MSLRSKLIPGVFLVIGLVGLMLVVLALLPSERQSGVPIPLQPATLLPGPASSPTATSMAVSTSAVAPTASPTAAATATVARTPTPTLPPVSISAPLASSNGQLAYVEDGELTVVAVDGSSVRVAEEGAGHEAQAVAWSPDGRRLLYVGGAGEAAYRVWDSKTGTTLDLGLGGSGLPNEVEGFKDIDWSPQGSRLLFRGLPDGSPGIWVLDLETERLWQVSDRAVMVAGWVDEEMVLFEARGEAVSEDGPTPSMPVSISEIGPPPRVLTETLRLTGGILGVPYAVSPDRRYLARLDVGGPHGPRLEVAPFPGHPSLTSFAQSLTEDPSSSVVGGKLLWSPDSRWIACIAEASASPGEQGTYTVLVDTVGRSETQGEDAQGDGSRIITGFRTSAWSPDSRLLTGLACSKAECRLAVIDVVSGQMTTVASGETLQLWDVAWSPGGAYLAYSLTGPDAESTGLMMWDRGTADHLRLMSTSGLQPITNLQWTPDGCRLYVARREDGARSGLSVAAIWGLGPAWEDLWQVAPGSPVAGSARGESSEANSGDGPRLCPAAPLTGRRLIAYYGTPLGPGLGVLGRNGITATLDLLKEQAQVYRELDPNVETIPVFHMVTTIADPFPGDDGDYNHRVPHGLLRQWVSAAEAAGGWSVLDVQPGRAALVTEWDIVEPLLREPTVHLAVDPEFIVSDAEVPGEDLGRITGSQVNHLQAWLDGLGRTIGHRKMLIIHQFDDRMIHQKGMILDYPFVELVWDADGFGGPGAKIGDYNQYRQEMGFEHGGFKLFYDEDEPLMMPEQVLSLEPPPRVVIYQ